MSKGFFKVPKAVNEQVMTYAPGSAERKEVLKTYRKMWESTRSKYGAIKEN